MRRRSEDPRFRYYEPNDRSPAALSHKADKARLDCIHRALIETVEVTVQGRKRKMPRLATVIDAIKRDCLRGDAQAVREHERITQLFLREKNALHAAVSTAEKSEVAQRMQVQRQLNDYSERLESLAYALHVSKLEYFYFKMNGEPVPFQFSVPSRVDPDLASEFLVGLRRQRPIRRDPEAGYKRPPSRTRFRDGQSGNPSGKRKDAGDMFEPLRASLKESVTVLKGERFGKMPAAYVTCVKVAESAVASKPAARRQIREWLIELDRWGLLNTTPSQLKGRWRKIDPEKKALKSFDEDQGGSSRPEA